MGYTVVDSGALRTYTSPYRKGELDDLSQGKEKYQEENNKYIKGNKYTN